MDRKTNESMLNLTFVIFCINVPAVRPDEGRF